MIKVRRARHPDVTKIVKCGRVAHEKSRFSWAPYSPAKARKNITHMLGRPDCAIFIAEDEGEVCGVLIGMHDEMLQCNVRYAVDLEFFAERGGRELVAAFEQWARANGCSEFLMADSNGGRTDAKDRFFAGMAMDYTGGVYAKRLQGDST